MTDPIADLTAASILLIGSLSYQYRDSEGLVVPQRLLVSPPRCPAKPAGELRLVFSPSDLGIDRIAGALGMTLPSFHIFLDGHALPPGPGGSFIRWEVSPETIGLALGNGVRLETIRGGFTTRVASQAQSGLRTPDCSGAERWLYITFDSLREPSDGFTLGLSRNGKPLTEIIATTIDINGMAGGSTVRLAANIRFDGGGCGLGVVAGKTLRCHGPTPPPGIVATYAWRVTGALLLSSDSAAWVDIQLPDPPQPVHLALTVSAAGEDDTRVLVIEPLSHEVAALVALICRLRNLVLLTPPFRPIGPLLPQGGLAFTRSERLSLHAKALQIRELADRLLEATSREGTLDRCE